MTTPAPPRPTPRATKPIRVDDETYEIIWRLREPGEPIHVAVRRLLTKALDPVSEEAP